MNGGLDLIAVVCLQQGGGSMPAGEYGCDCDYPAPSGYSGVNCDEDYHECFYEPCGELYAGKGTQKGVCRDSHSNTLYDAGHCTEVDNGTCAMFVPVRHTIACRRVVSLVCAFTPVVLRVRWGSTAATASSPSSWSRAATRCRTVRSGRRAVGASGTATIARRRWCTSPSRS